MDATEALKSQQPAPQTRCRRACYRWLAVQISVELYLCYAGTHRIALGFAGRGGIVVSDVVSTMEDINASARKICPCRQ